MFQNQNIRRLRQGKCPEFEAILLGYTKWVPGQPVLPCETVNKYDWGKAFQKLFKPWEIQSIWAGNAYLNTLYLTSFGWVVTVAQCLWPCASVQRASVGITLQAIGYQFTPRELSFSSTAITLQIWEISCVCNLTVIRRGIMRDIENLEFDHS